jgi:hypothetical protein
MTGRRQVPLTQGAAQQAGQPVGVLRILALGAHPLDGDEVLLRDQGRVDDVFRDHPPVGVVPAHDVPMPEAGVARVEQVVVGALAAPELPWVPAKNQSAS